jgi:hypothetical protein
VDRATPHIEFSVTRARVRANVDRAALQVGAVESFRVGRRIDATHVRLLSSRFTIVARDGGALTADSTVRLRLVAVRPTITFHLVADGRPVDASRSIAHAAARNAGFTDTADARVFPEVIVTSHRVLTASLLRLAARLWSRVRDLPSIRTFIEKGARRRVVRSIVELADREIVGDESGEATIGWMTIAIPDFSRWSDSRDDRSAQPRPVRSIGEYLRRATGKPSELVQLTNVLRPTSDIHWIHIPIGATRGTAGTRALLRVAWNTRSNRSVRAVLVVESEMGAGTWFEFSLPDAKLTRVATETGRDAETDSRYLTRLRRLIASLHSDAEPRTMGGDGFDLREPSVEPGALERYG